MAQPITVGSAGGEYMDAVVVLEWAVKVGDRVITGDLLVTVETAKAATEVVAPCDGVLTAIFAETGSEVALTVVMGLIGTELGDTAIDHSTVGPGSLPPLPASEQKLSTESAPSAASSTHGGRIIASPAVRRAATRDNLNLKTISPSSPTGRIKLRDLVTRTAIAADIPEDAPNSKLPPDQIGPLKIYRSGTKSGIPVVLLHGFASDALSWYSLERELSKSNPVIRIDLPNHGLSPRRRMQDFKLLAREIVNAFEALHLDNAHLVGHSLGGACALALADVRPRKMASLSLLAPAGLGPQINGDFTLGISKASRRESLEQWLKLLVRDQRLIGSDFLGAAMAARADVGLRAAQQQMAQDIFPYGTQTFDLRSALGRVTCPTRIIWGKYDPIIPWHHALAAPGRVALHLFEEVGHVPQLEIPETVRDILLSAFNVVEAKR